MATNIPVALRRREDLSDDELKSIGFIRDTETGDIRPPGNKAEIDLIRVSSGFRSVGDLQRKAQEARDAVQRNTFIRFRGNKNLPAGSRFSHIKNDGTIVLSGPGGILEFKSDSEIGKEVADLIGIGSSRDLVAEKQQENIERRRKKEILDAGRSGRIATAEGAAAELAEESQSTVPTVRPTTPVPGAITVGDEARKVTERASEARQDFTDQAIQSLFSGRGEAFISNISDQFQAGTVSSNIRGRIEQEAQRIGSAQGLSQIDPGRTDLPRPEELARGGRVQIDPSQPREIQESPFQPLSKSQFMDRYGRPGDAAYGENLFRLYQEGTFQPKDAAPYDPNIDIATPFTESAGTPDNLFERIKSGDIRPDPNNPEWTELYINGQPTDTQKIAFAMWDSFLRYKDTSAGGLFGAIKEGMLRPDPQNPAWNALYQNGQPTLRQREAYDLWLNHLSQSDLAEADKITTTEEAEAFINTTPDPEDISSFDVPETREMTVVEGVDSTDVINQINETLGINLSEPDKSQEQLFLELQDEYKITELTEELQGWDDELEEALARLRDRSDALEQEKAPLGVIAGRINEVTRQERKNIDFLTRQRNSVANELRIKSEIVNNILQLKQQDIKDKRDQVNDYINNAIKIENLKLSDQREQRAERDMIADNSRQLISGLIDDFGADAFKIIDSQTFANAGFSGLEMGTMAGLLTVSEKKALQTDTPNTPFEAWYNSFLEGDVDAMRRIEDWNTSKKNSGTSLSDFSLGGIGGSSGLGSTGGQKITSNKFFGGPDIGAPNNDGIPLELRRNCVFWLRSIHGNDGISFPPSGVGPRGTGLKTIQDKIDVLILDDTYGQPTSSPVQGATIVMRTKGESAQWGHVGMVVAIDPDKRELTMRSANYGGNFISDKTMSWDDARIVGYNIPNNLRNNNTGGYTGLDKKFERNYERFKKGIITQNQVSKETLAGISEADKLEAEEYILNKFNKTQSRFEDIPEGVFGPFSDLFVGTPAGKLEFIEPRFDFLRDRPRKPDEDEDEDVIDDIFSLL